MDHLNRKLTWHGHPSLRQVVDSTDAFGGRFFLSLSLNCTCKAMPFDFKNVLDIGEHVMSQKQDI